MGKGAGATRLMGVPKSVNESYFISERARLDTLGNNIDFYNRKSGGFVIWENGHQHPEQGRNNNEFKFARVLANAGYQVYLVDESPSGVSFRLSINGSKTHPDARVGEYYYEQTTKDKNNKTYGILSALQHTSDKGVKLCAVYDRYGVLHRTDIQKGIDWYEHNRTTKDSSLLKLDGVIVVSKDNKIWWHDMGVSGEQWWDKMKKV